MQQNKNGTEMNARRHCNQQGRIEGGSLGTCEPPFGPRVQTFLGSI